MLMYGPGFRHSCTGERAPDGIPNPQVQLASGIPVESRGRFGKIDFAVPEMDFINKCARFDYQRDKVLVRTDPGVRKSVRRKQTRPGIFSSPDAEILCEPQPRCPFCGSDR